jgi:hypothetical protein
MKLFNLQLIVRINLIGELETDEQEPEPSITDNLPDDPVKATGKMLERYAKKLEPKNLAIPYAPDGPEGVSLNMSTKIAAGSFEELQAILQKFNAVLQYIAEPSTEPKFKPGDWK